MSGGVGADRKRGRKVTAPARYPINQQRPHRTLGLQTPEPQSRPVTGLIQSHPVLNGLHHVYKRAA
jgi:hypothetical protein